MRNTVRLNFEFSREYYPILKMLCAQKGKSFKDFASELLIREIEEYEDRLLAKKAEQRLSEVNENDNIDFDQAAELAGWNDAD